MGIVLHDGYGRPELHDKKMGFRRDSTITPSMHFRSSTSSDARLDDPRLDTQKVADDVGMSSRQLNRVLALRGQTVRRLIVAEHLDRARRLIKEAGSAKIGLAELAYTSGFSSPAQFSKRFRSYLGIGPSEVGASRDTMS